MADTARYTRTLQTLAGLGRLGVRFDLERLRPVLSRLGYPERRFPSVHLAGTNGKGSTAAMIAACLGQAGLRTGLYTSPHLSRFTERIRVNGAEVDLSTVCDLAQRVLEVEPQLTFFEAATVMALQHFADCAVEMAVLETGLGGRLDATNVVTPRVAVLTRIGLDHTDLLGPRLEDVAREKAGIIKPHVPVVSAPAPTRSVQQLVERRCVELNAPLWLMDRDFSLKAGEYQGPSWRLRGVKMADSPYQQQNQALSLAAVERLRQDGVQVSSKSATAALADPFWPGRLEWVRRRYLLDGAHNPCAARALARALEPMKLRFSLVVGMLGRRDVSAFLEPLLPYCARLVLTRPRSPRALDPGNLARELRHQVSDIKIARNLSAAIGRVEEASDPVLVTGSLYLVGEAREMLLDEPRDPEITADPLP